MASASNKRCLFLGKFQLFPDSGEFGNVFRVYLIAKCLPLYLFAFIIIGKTVMTMITESSLYCGLIFTASIFQDFCLASIMQCALQAERALFIIPFRFHGYNSLKDTTKYSPAC